MNRAKNANGDSKRKHGEEADSAWDEMAMEKVLWSEADIKTRVAELGQTITNDFAGKSLTVVGVATGAVIFLADLVREIKLPVTIDFVRMHSYGNNATSSGVPTCIADILIDVKDQHVLLVEVIIDSGITISTLTAHFGVKDVASFSVCTLLDKPSRRIIPIQLLPGGKFYCGFECPDEFIVGYGLDYAGQYRNLPYLGALKSHVYS